MNNKNKHIDDQVLLSILEGKASEKENMQFQNWLDLDASNKETFEKMKKIWKSSKELEVFSQIDVEADWKLVKAKSSSVFRKGKANLIMRYAATVLVLVSLSLIYLYQTTPGFGKLAQEKTLNKTEQVVLADGTQVHLNKKSKLVYPKYFNSKSRNVVLEGEAYFKVKSDPTKPFIITSGNAIIEVLGTSFNVRNESGGKTIVTVNSGKVSLKRQNSQERVYLTKGEKGVLHDSIITESINDELNFDSWKTGVLRFKDTPIPEVFKEIEKYYGVKITNKSLRLDTIKFNSSFNNESIDKVMDELELHLRAKTVKKGNHLIISDRKY